jgi:hypothetical protein
MRHHEDQWYFLRVIRFDRHITDDDFGWPLFGLLDIRFLKAAAPNLSFSITVSPVMDGIGNSIESRCLAAASALYMP